MHGPSVSWDEVVDRLRAFERYPRIWPTATANLRMVSAMRNDARFADVGRNVSHVSVVLWRRDRPNRITMVWSQPDGIAWSGSTGFVIDRWPSAIMVDSPERSVVPEHDVIAMLMTYLAF
jgi:hypothetical protein